jgi:hypothetical protein
MSALPQPSQPGAARAERRGHLRVVAASRHPGRYVAAMLVVAALGVFAVVALNAVAASSAFRARALEERVDELSQRADELGVRVSALQSPARVHRVAVERLGMVPAPRPSFLTLDDRRAGENKGPPGAARDRPDPRREEPGGAGSPVEAAAGTGR